jgi:hypothetical protein
MPRPLRAFAISLRKFSGRNIVLITDHSQLGDASLTQTLAGLGFCVEGRFL